MDLLKHTILSSKMGSKTDQIDSDPYTPAKSPME